MTVGFLFWRMLDRSENHNKEHKLWCTNDGGLYLTAVLYCDLLGCMARTREDTKWSRPYITFERPLLVEKKLNNWINFSNYYWEEWHLWLYRYRSLQAYVSNDEQCSLSSASSTFPNSTPKKKIEATSMIENSLEIWPKVSMCVQSIKKHTKKSNKIIKIIVQKVVHKIEQKFIKKLSKKSS